jgi:hypothetical protein
MLFVRNPTGASHTPAESASDDDCVAAAQVLAGALAELLTRPSTSPLGGRRRGALQAGANARRACRMVRSASSDQTTRGVLMAVLMILEWQDVTTEDYERVNETIGIRSDADAPEGLIEHVAALTDDDELVIVDLWESDEALGRFVETRLAPAIKQLELPEATPRMAQVHNHQPGSASEGNTLILIELEGATTDDYDAMAGSMPAHAEGGPGHPGHVHIAASDGKGLLVADLWPSPEAFGQFAQEQVGPAAQNAGVSEMDQRTLRVHNRIRGRSTVSS